MSKREKQTKWVKKIRITITDNESHAELFSRAATKTSLIIICSAATFLLLAIAYILIAYTPLRQTIPGYPSSESKQMAVANKLQIDSLEREISMWAFQVGNIQRVVTGRDPVNLDTLSSSKREVTADNYYKQIYAEKDSILRNEVQEEDAFSASSQKKKITQIEGLHFFTPIKGMITDGYNKAINHPFIDIAAAANTTVYSILDGTVISAGWNDDTGYTIQIQHDNNLISIYKHNEQLLRSSGDKVKAGTPIAIVGNTGKLSTGTHLHFELWHNGEAIDPTAYIKF